jgi:hypothetical protein
MKKINMSMEEAMFEEISKIPDVTISQFIRDAVSARLEASKVVKEESEFRLMKSQLAKLSADVQRLEAELKSLKAQPRTSASFAASQSIYVPQ